MGFIMEIKAFEGLRFGSNVVGDAGKCIAPPYDVIDSDGREKLYKQSDYNIVRIIKGKIFPDDSESDNQYSRAGETLDGWVGSGALVKDKEEAIYAYVQNFDAGAEHFQRSGFIALGKLKEFGEGVQPHEKTLDGPKADRLKLMQATNAQFGQIFMLYGDPEKIADEIINKSINENPLIDFVDDDKVRHRLFAIKDQSEIKAIAEMMAKKEPIIADGHHRYETALNYCKLSGNDKAKYRMMTFVNMKNEGLVILPTHRLVSGLDEFDMQTLLGKIKTNFDITKISFEGDGEKKRAKNEMFKQMKNGFDEKTNSFGIYAANGAFYEITLKDAGVMDSECGEMSDAAKKLDVNILHKLILEKVLGIGDKQLAGESNIKYIKDVGDAVEKSIGKVDTQKSQAVFFMNPTHIQQVEDIAAAGEKMPQKSTFFHPKIYTGLVINQL
jgi:uncharacterized protein (DUF1015 family)